ncbi:MAG: hypothetical protein HY823_00880 [Acidobacteria bacterium]|nr:hypothetical protein [Acidobacteriota bacterium]
MIRMDLAVYGTCFAFSEALMVLFVLVNYPYYKICYGSRIRSVLVRTVFLNSLAILVGWAPVVYFWPGFSQKYLLPLACVVGALGCVGSRFIYQEIIPEALAGRLVEFMERRSREP